MRRNKWRSVCPKNKIRKHNGVDTKVITATNDFIQIRLQRLWANIDVLLRSGSTGEKKSKVPWSSTTEAIIITLSGARHIPNRVYINPLKLSGYYTYRQF